MPTIHGLVGSARGTNVTNLVVPITATVPASTPSQVEALIVYDVSVPGVFNPSFVTDTSTDRDPNYCYRHNDIVQLAGSGSFGDLGEWFQEIYVLYVLRALSPGDTITFPVTNMPFISVSLVHVTDLYYDTANPSVCVLPFPSSGQTYARAVTCGSCTTFTSSQTISANSVLAGISFAQFAPGLSSLTSNGGYTVYDSFTDQTSDHVSARIEADIVPAGTYDMGLTSDVTASELLHLQYGLKTASALPGIPYCNPPCAVPVLNNRVKIPPISS